MFDSIKNCWETLEKLGKQHPKKVIIDTPRFGNYIITMYWEDGEGDFERIMFDCTPTLHRTVGNLGNIPEHKPGVHMYAINSKTIERIRNMIGQSLPGMSTHKEDKDNFLVVFEGYMYKFNKKLEFIERIVLNYKDHIDDNGENEDGGTD